MKMPKVAVFLITAIIFGSIVAVSTVGTGSFVASAQELPQYRFPCTVMKGGNWTTVANSKGWTDEQLLNDINTRGIYGHYNGNTATKPQIDLNAAPGFGVVF